MKVRIESIQKSSFLAAVAIGGAGALVSLLSGVQWWWCAVSFAAMFLTGYAMTYVIMRTFTIYKLRPLYQIVLSKDVEISDMEGRLSQADQYVGGIEGEVTSWAERNRREIARLKENEKYRKEYVGNVSHEIKTPIFNIQGYILTLLDGALEDPAINRTYLERAEKSIDRLINIVNDLDQISKLESGVLKLKPERFDVAALARETAEDVDVEAAKKGIKIVVGPPSGGQLQPVYVNADKHYISQVLINLLTNSIKYGNEGGRTRISFVDLFDKIMVEVADNGVGITKEDIPRVFERFYRTDKSRSRAQGGTGLGLSIVKHIIEAHGESITVRSQPGKGSTFSFTLTKG